VLLPEYLAPSSKGHPNSTVKEKLERKPNFYLQRNFFSFQCNLLIIKATISALFLRSSTIWNMDLLHYLFFNQEIELITSLPLGRGSSEDKLIWPHLSSGIYSVKSGYNFLSNEKASASLGNLRPPELQGLRKHIWTCKVPNKVRIFLESL